MIKLRFARDIGRKLCFTFSYDASKCRKCHMKYNNCGVSPVLGILLRHVRSLISTTNQYFITMYAVVLKMDPPSTVNDEIVMR